MLGLTYTNCHLLALYAECHYAECRYAECRDAKSGAHSIKHYTTVINALRYKARVPLPVTSNLV